MARPKSLADYPRAALCGPEAAEQGRVADRCTDARVKADPSWRTTTLTCDGAAQVDGELHVCSHGCHELPKIANESARHGA